MKNLSEHDQIYMRVAARHLLETFKHEEIYIEEDRLELMTEDGINWEIEPIIGLGVNSLRLKPDNKNIPTEYVPSVSGFLKERNYTTGLIAKTDGWYCISNKI